MTNNIIYVAIRKDNGLLMVGQKGQAAFTEVASLRKSLAYAYKYEGQRKGVKVSELYSVHEIDVDMLLPKGGEVE